VPAHRRSRRHRPQRDVDRYERLAAQHGLRIVATAETHIHADFLSGSRELAEKGAHVFVSDEGDADWKHQWLQSRTGGGAYAHTLLKDGDSFMVGNIRLTAVHTPGHTPEHLCYLVTDLGGGATEPMGVASGDFMFVGDLGRPDLLESAAGIVGKADPSAHRLFATVQRVQRKWPDWLQVWPGHCVLVPRQRRLQHRCGLDDPRRRADRAHHRSIQARRSDPRPGADRARPDRGLVRRA